MDEVCIFCKEGGSFTTKEHIVPESLGNDSEILIGCVCDKCQNYIALNIEKPALEKTPFAFWRTFLGIRTKQRKLPAVDMTPKKGGKIIAEHPLTDNLGFTAHIDGSTSIDVEDIRLINRFRNNTSTFRLVLSPWHLNIITRFLGKMGLEFIANEDINLALSSQFDLIRRHIRQNPLNLKWPLYYGNCGDIENLKGDFVDKGPYYEQEISCYRYNLGISKLGEHIFVFSIGTDVYLLCLSHNRPETRISYYLEDIEVKCLHYLDY